MTKSQTCGCALEAERDSLKAELEVRSTDPLIDNHMDYLQQQADLWKSRAEKLAEAVRAIAECSSDTDAYEIRVAALAAYDREK